MNMASLIFVSIFVQVYLLSFHFVAGFHTPTTHLNRGGFSRLNSFVTANVVTLQPNPSFFSSIRNELGRTINIIFNATLERKIVVLAHPLIIFLLYLLATSKLSKNVGRFFLERISKLVSSVKSSMDQSPKTSAKTNSSAKEKPEDRKPEEGEGLSFRPAAAAPLSVEKELSPSSSNAMAAKIAELEAREIAYMKAQKSRREAAMRAANDKAKAIEIERSRVMSISRSVRIYDEFRNKHDPNFRRWKNQQGADKKREVEMQTVKEQNLAEEALQRQHILAANLIDDARKLSLKVEDENRSAAKAAAEKFVKDGQLAYGAQVKDKADNAARIKAEKIAHAAIVAAEQRKLIEEVAAVRQWRKEEAFVNAKRNILEQMAAMEKTQSSHWTPQNMVEE